MDAAGAPAETHAFQAEVAELLNLMVHSVYSETDIFLRELVSNASDACDKLRYEAIAKPDLLAGADKLAIRLVPDKTAGTLAIADTGIGMDRQELIDNLGTVARSGTRAFLKGLAEAKEGASLIGQFGVGFYAAFMVADRIEVTSRRAGATEAWVWTSSGGAGFELAPASDEQAKRVPRGTEVRLHLKEDAKRYLEPFELERLVRTYSDHILFPIELLDERARPRQVNAASALWQRAKSEVKPEDYTQAYRSIAMAFDEPALTLHYKVEGRQSYAVLLFVPSTPPFDLGDPNRKGRVKLYVRRVFITDDADLLPPWLRFVRGVVDSEDLPLNISREMLQNNPQVTQIRNGLVSRVIGELESAADKDAETYGKIWNAFGPVLKEGLYEDQERRGQLLALTRFATTAGERPALAQAIRGRPETQPDRDLLSRGRERGAGEIQPQARGGPRARHRSAAADRSDRRFLDDDAAGIRGQAAEVAEPGRRRFRAGALLDQAAGRRPRPTRTPASSRRSRTRWPTRSRRCAPRSG